MTMRRPTAHGCATTGPPWHPPFWGLLGTDHPVLNDPYARIGGGLVTTIHDGGLMALWQHDDKRRESIVVKIDTTAVPDVTHGLKVTCTLVRQSKRPQPEEVVIEVNSDSVVLSSAEDKECRFGWTDPIRRNSLAAGDTVRGVMAYGLWEPPMALIGMVRSIYPGSCLPARH